ncbi:MAG: hypothetical protein ACOH18_05105 [Candidatus Saccharimonadaceae bacterium]
MAKFLATFAVVSVMSAAIFSASSYAVEGDPAPPVVTPAACSVAPPEVFTAGLQFSPNAPTNNPGLQWNWTFTPPETVEGQPAFTVDSYGYAIYNGTTLQSQGTLAAAATTLGYAAPTDGTYNLYLWTVQGDSEPVYCAVGSIPFDATPPVIINNGYALDDKTGIATPLLSTDEASLTYSWAVNGLDEGVEIDNLAALNPNFTFSLDDTYNFTLTATDIFGNITTTPLTIKYIAPFVVPPTGPAIISEELLPEPVQSYTPIEKAPPIAYSAPKQTDDGKLPPEVDASIYAATTQGQDTAGASEKRVSGVVSVGNSGWKIAGVAWYWWVLIVASISAALLWVVRTYQFGFALQPDDV